MAPLLNHRVNELPSFEGSFGHGLIVQLIQGALLGVVLWYALKVVLREPVQRPTPAPDGHWGVAAVGHAGAGPVGKG